MQGIQGIQGPIGPTGPTGPTGTALSQAYATFYTTGGGTVFAGVAIPFAAGSTISQNITITDPTTVTVQSAGIYQIDYGVNTTASLNAVVQLYVNGSAVNGTQLNFPNANGQISGSVILSLPAGAALQLFVTGAALALSTQTGAFLTLMQIA